MARPKLIPIYPHDCDHCVFMTRTMGRELIDWYVHVRNGKAATVIARYAEPGICYNSYPVELLDDAQTAIGKNLPNNVYGEFEQRIIAKEILHRYRTRPRITGFSLPFKETP